MASPVARPPLASPVAAPAARGAATPPMATPLIRPEPDPSPLLNVPLADPLATPHASGSLAPVYSDRTRPPIHNSYSTATGFLSLQAHWPQIRKGLVLMCCGLFALCVAILISESVFLTFRWRLPQISSTGQLSGFAKIASAILTVESLLFLGATATVGCALITWVTGPDRSLAFTLAVVTMVLVAIYAILFLFWEVIPILKQSSQGSSGSFLGRWLRQGFDFGGRGFTLNLLACGWLVSLALFLWTVLPVLNREALRGYCIAAMVCVGCFAATVLLQQVVNATMITPRATAREWTTTTAEVFYWASRLAQAASFGASGLLALMLVNSGRGTS